MQPIPKDLDALLAGERTPQRAFPYPLERWKKWTQSIDGVSPVLDNLPERLNRSDAAKIIEDLTPTNLAGAFTTAMVWGHGDSGYGPYRTAAVLTGSRSPRGQNLSSEVEDRLRDSVEVARAQGAVEGYRLLKNTAGKIKGLGPAFFTKWLYFVTARGNEHAESAAPILDALVISWLSNNANVGIRAGYTDEYARYIELLNSWGQPHGLSAVQVEESIFRLIRNDGEE